MEIKNNSLSLVEYVKKAKLDYFYSLYLCNFSPEDFELVGFTEYYDVFVSSMSSLLNFNISSDIHLRKGSKDPISQDDYFILEEILKEEMDLYYDYLNKWN